MTRADILREYTVADSRITSPGKFEAEHLYMPVFYQAYLEGFADEVGQGVLPVGPMARLRPVPPVQPPAPAHADILF